MGTENRPHPVILEKGKGGELMTLEELELVLSPDVLVGLADDDGDGVADAGVVAAAGEAAKQQVRDVVAGTVTLPAGDLPPLLRDIVRTLAIERLYERRRETMPGPWSDRAERARRLLADVSSGFRSIDGAMRSGEAIRTNREVETRQHHNDNLERY